MSESDSGRWPSRSRERRDRRAAATGGPPQSPPAVGEDERRQGTPAGNGSARRTGVAAGPLETDAQDGFTPEEGLLAAARAAREFAQAHYSKFKVGAALETVDGQIVTGCNIENATYGLTLCAERVALVKALSDGHTVFTRIAVVADTDAPTPPCGPCRQLLWEYCGDIEVVLGNLRAADRPPPALGAAAAAVRSAAAVAVVDNCRDSTRAN